VRKVEFDLAKSSACFALVRVVRARSTQGSFAVVAQLDRAAVF